MQQQMPPQGMPQMPPEMPQMPQPPIPPGGDPSMQPPAPGGEPITPEEKQVLVDLIAKIKANLASLQATQFAGDAKVDVLRQDLLKQVFEKLQMAGVDLTSRESVSEFIMRLQEQNPELAQMFEKSMDILMGTPAGQALGGGEDPNAPTPVPPEGMDPTMQDPSAQGQMIG